MAEAAVVAEVVVMVGGGAGGGFTTHCRLCRCDVCFSGRRSQLVSGQLSNTSSICCCRVTSSCHVTVTTRLT